jgi:hypothetical protein
MDLPKGGGSRLCIRCLDSFAMFCFEAGKSFLDCCEPGLGHKNIGRSGRVSSPSVFFNNGAAHREITGLAGRFASP